MPGTFDWMEDAGARDAYELREVEVRFGDGYSQRAPDGLNPEESTHELTFSELDEVTANDIITFLRGNVGASFSWTPLGTSTAIKVKCTRFNRTLDAGFRYTFTVSATFERVYEP
jgi:phage-related protein